MNTLQSRLVGLAFAALAGLPFAVTPSQAIDPPYQQEMQRLTEIMGSLYFLQPLCGFNDDDWRNQASDLISSDDPDDDRRARLIGAFNEGYAAYARLYRTCTPSADEAMQKLLSEAEKAARDIHSRYAE